MAMGNHVLTLRDVGIEIAVKNVQRRLCYIENYKNAHTT